jgi:GDP-D-mannose dehydratase
MKKAPITGIADQCGFWFEKIFLKNWNNVHGGFSRSCVFDVEKTGHFYNNRHQKDNHPQKPSQTFHLAIGDAADLTLCRR